MNKSALRLPAICLFGIFALYGCVLAPLYQYLIADIVMQNTLWLDVVDLLFQHTEIYGDALLFGFLIGAVYRYGIRDAKPMLVLCGGALAFKYVATVAAISIIYGYIDLTGGLTEYLFAFLLEAALAALAVFLAYKLAYPQRECEADLPSFKHLFSLKNPLRAAVFFSMLAVLVWRLVAFIISDFAFGFDLRADEIPVMLLYWLILIILPSFFGYLIALRCTHHTQK